MGRQFRRRGRRGVERLGFFGCCGGFCRDQRRPVVVLALLPELRRGRLVGRRGGLVERLGSVVRGGRGFLRLIALGLGLGWIERGGRCRRREFRPILGSGRERREFGKRPLGQRPVDYLLALIPTA